MEDETARQEAFVVAKVNILQCNSSHVGIYKYNYTNY